MVFKITATRIALAGAALTAVALRLAAMPRALDATDPVNFALALERFDLTLHQPHVPGYPLFVLAARLCALCLDNGFAALCAPGCAEWTQPVALALPGILGSALLVWASARAVRGRAGDTAAILAAWLIAVAAPLVEVGAAPASDGLALAVFGAAFACAFIATERGTAAGATTRGLAIAGLLCGLGLGVRPSAAALAVSFVLLIPLLARGRRPFFWASAGLVGGTLVWALPFVALVGPKTLVSEGLGHVAGHFAVWGGVGGGRGARAIDLAARVGSGLWPAIVLALALLRRVPRAALRRGALVTAVLVMPYATWVWLAQNVERTRHAAPLVLVVCVAVACVVARVRWAAGLAVAGVLVVTFTGWHDRPAPWRRDAVRFIETHLGLERVVVVGTHLPRVARFYSPALRTGQAVDGADVARVASALGDGITVVSSSEVPGLTRDDLRLEPLARFRDRTLYVAHFVGGAR